MTDSGVLGRVGSPVTSHAATVRSSERELVQILILKMAGKPVVILYLIWRDGPVDFLAQVGKDGLNSLYLWSPKMIFKKD